MKKEGSSKGKGGEDNQTVNDFEEQGEEREEEEVETPNCRAKYSSDQKTLEKAVTMQSDESGVRV